MNDTNNMGENNVNTSIVQNGTSGEGEVPVQNNMQAQGSVPVQNVEPIQQSQTVVANVNNQTQNNDQAVQSVDEKANNNVNQSLNVDGALTKSQEEEVKNAKLRFPIIVTILFIVFIILFILYYFVLINPNKMYNKMLKISIDRITGLLDFNNSSDEFINTEAKIVVDTKSVDFDSKDYLEYIDGLTYKINFNRDNKNNNFQLTLNDNILDMDNASEFTFGNPVYSDMYYMGSNIYSKPKNNFIAVRSNLGSEEDDSIYSLLSEYLYEVVDNINLEKVNRKFATKKVNNQTLLAIKYELDYNSTDLQKLSEVTTNNILDTSKHPEFVKKLANFTDMDENTIKNLIKSIQDLTKNTESVKFNYYMNISFTNIICMEMITDSGTFSISYLNDYYFVDYNSNDNSVKYNLVINFENLDLSGDIVIDTSDGYSHLVLDTDYKINDKNYKLDSNVITLKAFDKDKEKPYMSIVAELNHNYDEKIIKADSIKSINRDEASSEEIEMIEYASNKMTYELSYLMVLFTKNKLDMNIKDILNNMNNSDNNFEDNTNDNGDVSVDDNNVNNDGVDNTLETPDNGENVDISNEVSTQSE